MNKLHQHQPDQQVAPGGYTDSGEAAAPAPAFKGPGFPQGWEQAFWLAPCSVGSEREGEGEGAPCRTGPASDTSSAHRSWAQPPTPVQGADKEPAARWGRGDRAGLSPVPRVPLSGSRPAWSSREDRRLRVGLVCRCGGRTQLRGRGAGPADAAAWVPTGGSGALAGSEEEAVCPDGGRVTLHRCGHRRKGRPRQGPPETDKTL